MSGRSSDDGQVVVIKLGGSAGIESQGFLRHLARFKSPYVLVHGANVELDTLTRRLGLEPRLIQSSTGQVSRYTDRETMDLFLMVYCGKVNKRTVETLQSWGVNAVGLSAMDGRIATGRRKERIRVVEGGKQRMLEGDFAGSIQHIDTALIRLLITNGYTPVLSPPALSDAGEAINVDGDKLAMRLAVALGAKQLLVFSNTPGLLRDVGDDTSLVPQIDLDEIEGAVQMAQGRMKKKVLAAADAVRLGVGEVILAGANQPDAIEAALAGGGTH
ncbi:MAG: [LysW]-aminoadipate kinase, partial [Chloroflexota bacterium]